MTNETFQQQFNNIVIAIQGVCDYANQLEFCFVQKFDESHRIGCFHPKSKRVLISRTMTKNSKKKLFCVLLHEVGHALHFKAGFNHKNTNRSEMENLANAYARGIAGFLEFNYDQEDNKF